MKIDSSIELGGMPIGLMDRLSRERGYVFVFGHGRLVSVSGQLPERSQHGQ